MKKILYKAIDENGQVKNGFIDANSNKQALEKLAEQGLSQVQLLDDSNSAFHREDLEDLPQEELDAIANFEAKIRSNPSIVTFLIEVFRVNKIVILIGLAIFVWGIIDNSTVWMTIGALVSLSLPALSLWNYRQVINYDNLQRTIARGQWSEALNLIDKLEPKMTAPEMAFDLAVRKACILAHLGEMQEAEHIAKEWQGKFDDTSPGMYESRIAMIYHSADDYETFLNLMRDAYFKSSCNSSFIVDLALAEARLGDKAKAKMLLEKLNVEELPVYGLPFLDWVNGIIDSDDNQSQAMMSFNSALSAMVPFSDNPTFWTSLAMCIGSFADAANDSDTMSKAREMLESVKEILTVHADKPLLERLADKYPEVIQA